MISLTIRAINNCCFVLVYSDIEHVNDFLFKILNAVEVRKVPRFIKLKENLIKSERRAIENYLKQDNCSKIYGFNTFLGPLDNINAIQNYQKLLFDAHCLGTPSLIHSAEILHLATLVKLTQLSHGGSGISLETFKKLQENAYVEMDGLGAWKHSYSSGDVVPATWWVKNVLSDYDFYDKPGDFIALINGNFFSTAISIYSFKKVVDIFSKIIFYTLQRCPMPVNDCHIPVELRSRAKVYHHPNVQLPVSHRDTEPVIRGSISSLKYLSESIEKRLSKHSGNPIIVVKDNQVEAHSNGSFLDPSLTSALQAVSSTMFFNLCALQRFSQNDYENSLKSNPGNTMIVQPPKLSMSLLHQASLLSSVQTITPIVESGGVEDLADGSLLKAYNILEMCLIAEEMLMLYELFNSHMSDQDFYHSEVSDIKKIVLKEVL